MITTVPADQDVRDRLRSELGTTFFVEAGAGTGKTKELVERIVGLVASGVPIESIAAITFTDAAAAELRGRVRLELEQASANVGLPADQQVRCTQGALDIDLAAIQTIHSFAAGLLRLFPLEAELPPGFTVWNELEHGIAFKERFRRWLYDEVPGHAKREQAVRLALALGLSANQLQGLAARLQDHYDLLDPVAHWRPTELPDPVEAAHRVGLVLRSLEAFQAFALNPDGDPLAAEIRAAQPVAQRLSEATDEEEALVALKRFRDLRINGFRGRQTDWDTNAAGNVAAQIKDAIRDANEQANGVLVAYRVAALGDLLAHLRDFTLAFARERCADGVATFHDLLVWVRDLLRDRPDVRRRARDRFQRVLVDEFQDTDPLQVEIAWFLTADPKLAHEKDWRKLKPEPGRLFVVGDPKQSIYRFRRADIGIYEDVREALGEGSEMVALTQNFRSVEPLLAWVNHHLGGAMQAKSGVQPEYRKLHPRPNGASLGSTPTVQGAYRLGGQVAGKAGERWLAEAREVADLAKRMVAEGWLVTHGNEAPPEPARYQDICVLLPTRTNLRRLARAFEDEGVPYRMESGSLVLNTPEVRDLLSCLRAIEDPSDQVALVAALRSPAYACSDVDLLAWAEAGGRLDYEHPFRLDAPQGAVSVAPGPARVQAALAGLARFHAERQSRSSAATIELFIRDRLLAVQSFGHPRPREAWRRLRYVVAQARRLQASGQPSLRSALDWLEGLQQESFYDAESAVPEGDEDAVRLMTVHGSKGLEFPIVILTGLGAVRSGVHGLTVAPDRRKARLEVYMNTLFATVGYDAAREGEQDQAEQVRLLYVAATRARDHLVLSLFHTEREKESNAGRILKGLQDVPNLCHTLDLRDAPLAPAEEPVVVPEPVNPDGQRTAEAAWLASRQLLVSELGAERRFTATSLAHATEPSPAAVLADEAPSEPSPAEFAVREGPGEGRVRVPEDVLDLQPESDSTDDPDVQAAEVVRRLPAGRAATALGLAVHSVLQAVDLATLEGLDKLALIAAAQFRLPGGELDIASLVRSATASTAVRAALRSGRLWREVPVGVSHAGTLLEGYIDLLYEREDGTLAVVDYKTDHISASDLDNRVAAYRLQGGAYAFAVQQALNRPVSSVEFVFAALGQTVLVPDLDSVVLEVKSALSARSV